MVRCWLICIIIGGSPICRRLTMFKLSIKFDRGQFGHFIPIVGRPSVAFV